MSPTSPRPTDQRQRHTAARFSEKWHESGLRIALADRCAGDDVRADLDEVTAGAEPFPEDESFVIADLTDEAGSVPAGDPRVMVARVVLDTNVFTAWLSREDCT